MKSLFDIPVYDPIVPPIAHKRLNGHSKQILEWLKQRPATGKELCVITHRFSARIMDLRRAGYVIQTEIDDTTGKSIFRLIGK